MNYLKKLLPWTPLIVAVLSSLILQFTFSIEKTASLVSFGTMLFVYYITLKFQPDKKFNINTSDIELQKCKKENENLKDNLLQVYNMVKTKSQLPPSQIPPSQLPPQVQTQQPPRAEIQNQSTMPSNGGPNVDDVDGKPYL